MFPLNSLKINYLKSMETVETEISYNSERLFKFTQIKGSEKVLNKK